MCFYLLCPSIVFPESLSSSYLYPTDLSLSPPFPLDLKSKTSVSSTSNQCSLCIEDIQYMQINIFYVIERSDRVGMREPK